jgi:hypothetical protein
VEHRSLVVIVGALLVSLCGCVLEEAEDDPDELVEASSEALTAAGVPWPRRPAKPGARPVPTKTMPSVPTKEATCSRTTYLVAQYLCRRIRGSGTACDRIANSAVSRTCKGGGATSPMPAVKPGIRPTPAVPLAPPLTRPPLSPPNPAPATSAARLFVVR